MRIARVVVLLWLIGGVSACTDRNATGAAPDPAAIRAQHELSRRRDALLAERQRLEHQRRVVLEQIEKAEASGGDTRELVKQRDDLTAQIDGESAEIDRMSDKLTSLVTKLDSAGGAADVAIREDRIAQREDRVAAREAVIGERERKLAAREEKLAQREKETCSVAPPVIIQTSGTDGKYTKADVQPLLARARRAMSKKGVLVADLPGPAQGLEAESTRAMADGDWGKAYFAAAQLVATVDAIKIDRAFIQAKTARLSDQVKASRPAEATSQRLTGVLSDVMQRYNDGNFAAANKRLNQLAALLK